MTCCVVVSSASWLSFYATNPLQRWMPVYVHWTLRGVHASERGQSSYRCALVCDQVFQLASHCKSKKSTNLQYISTPKTHIYQYFLQAKNYFLQAVHKLCIQLVGLLILPMQTGEEFFISKKARSSDFVLKNAVC